MGAPEPGSAQDELDALVETQAAAVLARLDDLGRDFDGSLHDARVAIRRLRSSLVVFAALLRDDVEVHELAADLRWLALELGQARDAQVVRSRVLAGLDEIRATDRQRHDLLDGLGAGAGDRGRVALTDRRLAVLRERLDRVGHRGCARPGTGGPEQVRARVRAALEETIAAAERPLPSGRGARDRALHRLRKRVKVVRAVLGVVPVGSRGSGRSQVATRLEDLQELLGQHQDAVVTAHELRRLADSGGGKDGVAAVLATSERRAARDLRADLPRAVRRLRTAVDRLERRTSERPAAPARSRD